MNARKDQVRFQRVSKIHLQLTDQHLNYCPHPWDYHPIVLYFQFQILRPRRDDNMIISMTGDQTVKARSDIVYTYFLELLLNISNVSFNCCC